MDDYIISNFKELYLDAYDSYLLLDCGIFNYNESKDEQTIVKEKLHAEFKRLNKQYLDAKDNEKSILSITSLIFKQKNQYYL